MKLSIIPEPVSFNIRSENIAFVLTDSVCFEGSAETENALSDLVSFLGKVFDFMPVGGGKEKIRLEISPCEPEEGYRITIQADRILLTGNSPAGLFYAVQSLKQLLFQSDGNLPEAEITDYPRFSSRSFMLDCARYFFTTEAVKQFLDMMALHKLNEFHWHLSDDQGFRCQLEGGLLLTEIGSYRPSTCFRSKPHEGYYTKAELQEIVAYAHSRYIKVIPEIDSPGHVMSMLAAYPELGCVNREYTVSSFFGVRHDVLCPGKESTFTFMEGLFDELMEIFTDKIIHIGGDEVPTVRWKSCPDCNRRMKQELLTDEGELRTYYLNRIAAHLKKSGAEVRMWNDSQSEKGASEDICRQLWNADLNDEDIIKALNNGKKFILSPSGYCYLDLPYALVSLEKSYSLNPVPDTLTKEGRENIIGIEACLWTELIPDMLKADKMTYPRLAAVCETAWSPEEKKNYNYFTEKLTSYRELLLAQGIRPCNLSQVNPKGVKKAVGRLYWERRKLLWGAHINIMSDIYAKKFFKKHNGSGSDS